MRKKFFYVYRFFSLIEGERKRERGGEKREKNNEHTHMKSIIYITRAVVKGERVQEAETSKCTMHTGRKENIT